jgi:hypothetical protein
MASYVKCSAIAQYSSTAKDLQQPRIMSQIFPRSLTFPRYRGVGLNKVEKKKAASRRNVPSLLS